ncbi:MAG TPA: hypothetical protein VF735_06755 [Pyrinomonadaceae bacterium]|jgi:hypothetical protein
MKPFLKVAALTLIVLNGASLAFGQDSDAKILAESEFGDISELKDLHRVFIVADTLQSRGIIVKEFSKYKGIELASRAEDAEFIIGFEIKSQSTGASIIGPSVTNDVTYYGYMYAVVAVRTGDKPRLRILWNTQKSQAVSGGFTLSRHPATNASREFIKALKKVRGEK